MNTSTTGPATPEHLNALHRAVVKSLLAKVKAPEPSAEELSACIAMLRNNGLCGLAQTDKDRTALQKLWGLLLSQLTNAMQVDSPSTSVIGQVRMFLAANGITKDLQGHTGKAQALAALTDASLPFTKH